jgi:hypothetical protein
MHKGLPFTKNHSRPMLTLRNSIVPMLYTPPLPENRVRIICNVARRVETCPAGFQIFVHYDAILHGDSSFLYWFHNRNSTYANNNNVTGNFLAIAEEHSLHRTPSFK